MGWNNPWLAEPFHSCYSVQNTQGGDGMKKKTIIILASCLLIVVAFVFRYYHPTHFAYNDRFIIGNTEEKIVEKYGEFSGIRRNNDGEIRCGIYKIRDNTPELIMSYDNSLWYEIYFEDGIAVEVKLQEGVMGG